MARDIQIEKDIVAILTAAISGYDEEALNIVQEYDPEKLIHPFIGVALAFIMLASKERSEPPLTLLEEWAHKICEYEILNYNQE